MPRVYFSHATFRFLRALARHNERVWFKAHQADYEADVREPFLQLIADLEVPLAKISPHFRADPRKVGGSLFRIQRDTRFHHNKAPYKPWAGARLFHARRREIAAPSFYLHIAPGGCFIGAGLWHPENHTLRHIRNFIVDNPATWRRVTRGRAFRNHYRFRGDTLIRAPQGFSASHPLLEDLKRKSFAAGTDFDDALACSPRLYPFVVAHYQRLAPLVDYLCAAQNLEF
jgi:uncharacterized protein (TIGR02453 family)